MNKQVCGLINSCDKLFSTDGFTSNRDNTKQRKNKHKLKLKNIFTFNKKYIHNHKIQKANIKKVKSSPKLFY